MRRLAIFVLLSGPALADPAVIDDARATRTAPGVWRIDVTLRHADAGWEDYADAWAVHAPDGTLLGTRELLHPHVEEQPFTRSLSGVEIPASLSEVEIRARTKPDGWGGESFTLHLP